MKTAKIKYTGQLIYTADTWDEANDNHGWYSHPDGKSYECIWIMDNRRFREMLKNQEVSFV